MKLRVVTPDNLPKRRVCLLTGWGPLLLAMACVGGGSGCQSKASPVATEPEASVKFVDATERLQLEFLHDCGPLREYFVPEIMGGGAAVLDFDRDGDLDIYLVNGRPSPGAADASVVPNRLFRRDAEGYVEVPDASGLADAGYGMGVACGDVNNDGWVDVLVTNYGANALYLNRGDGSFEDKTRWAGLDDDQWSTSAIFFDYDRDGWLDLYVANYVEYDPTRVCNDKSGRTEYCGPEQFAPAGDRLYRNQGDGSFVDVSDSSGITAARGRGLGVVAADFNQDQWLDLYVANDMDPNFLWVNQGDGTFRNDAIVLGVAFNAAGQTEASMGVLCDDLDGDLDFDLFMTHLRGESNTLYRNDGTGFQDATSQFGMLGSSLPYTGFGAAAGDFDLDGDLDIAFVNGHVFRGSTGQGSFWDDYAQPPVLLLNQGGRFQDASDGAGEFRGPPQIGRGLAVADLDDDGALDLVISNCNGSAQILMNASPRTGHWLGLRVLDAHGRDALGAVVEVTAGGVSQVRSVRTSESYLSSRDPRVHIGLGAAETVDEVVVTWPDGERQSFPIAEVDRYYDLRQGAPNTD